MSPSVVLNVKDRSQNHTVTFGKGSKYAEDAGKPKNEQQSALDQQRTHEQLSQKRKIDVDHPGNDIQY